MKTMRVILEVDVDDLPKAEREAAAHDMQIKENEIETLAEVEAPFAAKVLENIGEHTCQELFAGSDTYLTFKDVRVKSASWVADGAVGGDRKVDVVGLANAMVAMGMVPGIVKGPKRWPWALERATKLAERLNAS